MEISPDIMFTIEPGTKNGETFLNTSLKNFNKDLVITGSEQTKLYQEYQEMIRLFNSKGSFFKS